MSKKLSNIRARKAIKVLSFGTKKSEKAFDRLAVKRL
jgi:hypothetical protein